MRPAELFLDGHHDEHEIGIGDRLLLRRSDETLTILGLGAGHGRPKNAAFRRATRRIRRNMTHLVDRKGVVFSVLPQLNPPLR